MKYVPYVCAVAGFLLIIGTAGSADFYDECRAAADCVAGEPMSFARMITQSLIGIVMMGFGIFTIVERQD